MPSFIFPLIAFLLFVLAALALAFMAVLWYIFWRPLARTKQDMVVDALSAPVEIVRDRWGVPHIYARTANDAFLAQGYVHAQDRLFQLEYLRLLARGSLAESLGPAAQEADRWSHVIGFWRAAELDMTVLAPEDREALAAYTAGINTFLEANRLRKPAEFTIVGHSPLPWQVQDTLGILKVMGWALSMNWEGELVRMQLIQRLGPERAAELDPALHYGNSASVAGHALNPAALEAASQLMAAYGEVARWFGIAPAAGSNNWVVGPERVAGPLPLLANDPHLTISIPSLWYENHLETADGSLQVTGATFAGIPGVVSGHNADIAWGITAGHADNQDLYVEQRHPDEANSFRACDQWLPATVLREEIAVRGQADLVVQQVVITRHGPLINPLIPVGERDSLPPLALRWSGHSASSAVHGLLRLQTARDWPSFRAALSEVGEPSMNFVYADRSGNIGYQYAARVPKRRSGHGVVPPGQLDTHEWEDFVPFDDLPSQFNPPDGFAASANNRPRQADASPWIGADWDPGYRHERIVKLLQSKPRFTLRDFQRFQTDVYSGLAERLVPWFVLAEGRNQLERRVVGELEGWNLRMEVDSFPAAAFEVMRLHLLDILLSEKLGPIAGRFKGRTISDIFAASPFSGHTGPFLVKLLKNETSWWYGENDAGRAARTREAVLSLALQRTAGSLNTMIGKDPRKWAWGKVHQVEFSHPFGRGRVLHGMFNRGQYPIGGNDHTVWMTANELTLPFGLVTTTATYRQVMQVGDWDRSTSILSTGQSGQPGSPHYADHIDMWREGDQHPMLWSRSAVDSQAEATLWLHPPAAA